MCLLMAGFIKRYDICVRKGTETLITFFIFRSIAVKWYIIIHKYITNNGRTRLKLLSRKYWLFTKTLDVWKMPRFLTYRWIQICMISIKMTGYNSTNGVAHPTYKLCAFFEAEKLLVFEMHVSFKTDHRAVSVTAALKRFRYFQLMILISKQPNVQLHKKS